MISEAIEAVWRMSWPQRPPKWLLKATCTYLVVKGNMHIVPKVIEVAYFKSEVNIDI